MPDCRYCEASFDSESSYHSHLQSEHADELGPIDRRRLGLADEDEEGIDLGTIALWGVVVVPVVVVGYVIFGPALLGGGGSGSEGPYAIGSVHEHGTMAVVIDDQRIDFSRDRYQMNTRAFHFERGNGRIWHKHAKGVTLQWALETLGIRVTENSVTFDGKTYNASDPNTTISITVDGKPVDPSGYVLQGVPPGSDPGKGDSVRVVVNVTGG